MSAHRPLTRTSCSRTALEYKLLHANEGQRVQSHTFYSVPPLASSNQSASCWQTISFSAPSLKPGECHSAHISLTKTDAAAATSHGLQLNDSANLLHQTRPAASPHSAYLSKYCRWLLGLSQPICTHLLQGQFNLSETLWIYSMDCGMKCFVLCLHDVAKIAVLVDIKIQRISYFVIFCVCGCKYTHTHTHRDERVVRKANIEGFPVK